MGFELGRLANTWIRFVGFIDFFANPVYLYLEDQGPKHVGLKLLDLVNKLLSFSQVLLVARLIDVGADYV